MAKTRQEYLNHLKKLLFEIKLNKTDFEEADLLWDVIDYKQIKEQIDTMQTVTFGTEINVLLITDRLYGCAAGLRKYLQNSTDITVELVNTLEDAERIIEQKPIDFLIIVGYLENHSLYKAKVVYESSNKYSTTIMYAHLDDCICQECKENKIIYKYNRTKPIEGFLSYMRECYKKTRRQKQTSEPSKRMRIAIIGSRKLNVDILRYIPDGVTEIVTGGAKGIDTLAEAYADAKGIPKLIINPEYKKYGRAAPIKRNEVIVEISDFVVAIWDGKSRGTKYVIDHANKIGKPIKVYLINQNN